MRFTLGTGLFAFVALVVGYVYAYFIKSYVHFYEKPAGDIAISFLILAFSFFVFNRVLKKNEHFKHIILVIIPLALFSLNGFFWFYGNTDYLLLYNYLILMFLGFSISAVFKFPIADRWPKLHYAILVLFASAGFLIAYFSKQFDFAAALMVSVAVSYAVLHWQIQKWLSIGVIFISLGLLIIFFNSFSPTFFERQTQYEDLVVFSEETKFQKVDITTWKGNYWYYQNGVNHFSSIDSWLYFEPFVYPVLTQIKPESTLIIGGENGLLAAELLKQGLKIDLLPLDSDLVDLAKKEELFTSFNQNALSNQNLSMINNDSFIFLDNTSKKYDLIYIDAPDPVDVLTNQFYTQEFYNLIYNALSEDGLFVTQSGSPYFATEAYEMTKRTISESGFEIISYHNQVLSLGEWSWTIGSKKEQLKSALQQASFEQYNTKWLNKEAMQMMLSFGKSKIAVDSSLNTITDPKLYKYYLEGNFGLR